MNNLRYLNATYIHNGDGLMPKNTVIVIDEDGTITDITTKEELSEDTPIEFFDGILCPGFVNAHCHIELSNLYQMIPENTGLVNFVKSIPFLRMKLNEEQRMKTIEFAFDTMYQNGIVAVGDIANSNDTLLMRVGHALHVHTFVETMGFVPEGAQKRFDYNKEIYESFKNSSVNLNGKTLKQSMTPHAPYSVCEELYDMINEHEPGSVISVHNQESKDEILYFHNQSGKMNELYELLQIDTTQLDVKMGSTLDRTLDHIDDSHPLILVHNTFTSREDAIKAKERGAYFCLCPNANWYIERELPKIDMLIEEDVKICLGTDSLASNYNLSMIAEMQRILLNYPDIAIETLIRWATKNGAEALQLDDVCGTLKVGMQPGINIVKTDFTLEKIA